VAVTRATTKPLVRATGPLVRLKSGNTLSHGAPGSLVGTRFVLPYDRRRRP